MLDIRILIIAEGEAAAHAYSRVLSNYTTAYDVVTTFNEAQSMAREKPYNGILIDIVTMVRSNPGEKLIAYELINLYPTLRVKYDNKTHEMKLGSLEHALSKDPHSTLRLFIENRCMSFPGRYLRRHKRVNICLDLLLCRNDSFSQESIKTFTVDISVGGVFLHTTKSYQKGDRVWLRIKDLSDVTPIEAKVCWIIEWGSGSRSIAGIGVEFEILSESQKEEISHLVK